MSKPQMIMDLEVYSNYFLAAFMEVSTGNSNYFLGAFMEVSTGKLITSEINSESSLDVDKIESLLSTNEIITFNGNRYDMPLLRLALTGADNAKLKRASDEIIKHDLTAYQFENKFDLPAFECNHIDLIEVCPGKASLKVYGGRLHCKKMQDLPYDPKKILTKDEMSLVKAYCGNDLEITKLLLEKLKPQIDLRRKLSNQYKIDLRSKSDAQIAEAVIKAELQRKRCAIGKPNPPTRFNYKPPQFIQFISKQLKEALEIVTHKPFVVQSNGYTEMPKELLTLQIKLGSSVYQMGMGGLHSTEKSVYHIADNKTILRDADVTSYYPSIILNQGLYPPQLGKGFLDVYREIVETRLAAKATGDFITSEALKITINGSFGKLGSKYSMLFAPELMVQVTVTGQLSLLMLIEALELCDIQVISANTDGIVIKCPKVKIKEIDKIIKHWEITTGFNMEYSDYSALYSRDINNYIATKTDGKVKVKGCFKPGDWQKNPQNEICNEAAVQYLLNGKDIEDTITECKDITKFITVRLVKGGAVKNGVELGKAIRWYYAANERSDIRYKESNNLVPRTYGAKPLMEIPETFPSDINYKWYIEETKDLICDVGLKIKGQLDLF